MNPNRRVFSKNAAKIFDLCMLLLSYGFVTAQLYSNFKTTTLEEYLAYRVRIVNVFHLGLLLLVWHLIFSFCDLYVSKRLSTLWSEIVEVLKAVTLSTAFLWLTGAVFHLRTITPLFCVAFGIRAALLIVASRIIIRLFLRTLRSRGKNMRVMLILGTNRRAIQFAKRIQARPELGYQIAGFVDDEWEGSQVQGTGNTICADFAGFRHYLRHHVVDEVAIFVPLRSFYEYASQVVALCEQHGILIRFDTQIFDLKIASPGADELDGAAHITATATRREGWQIFMKRAVDLVLSLLLLVVLSPLLAAVAVAIKMTSSGPVFFKQKRVGLNKRQFTMFKFRTMVPNAEKLQELLLSQNEMSGPVFKIKKDPRVTAVGAFLRKTSIDELPQLWNVAMGDMSLVGPRAMSVRDYQYFDQDWQRRRFSVRPGITCLWQVKGRSNISFEKWMELDMLYIDKWSLWLDFKILVRTIPAVLRGTGAA